MWSSHTHFTYGKAKEVYTLKEQGLKPKMCDSKSHVFPTWEQGPYLMYIVTCVVLHKEYCLLLNGTKVLSYG